MTTSYVECDHCGSTVYLHDIIDDKITCKDCIEFFNYKFKRSHHPIWLIQMAIESLESKINKNQQEHIKLTLLDENAYPYCQHKLDSDSRQHRINQINEFLEQYYDLHEFLKQLYKIVRHKNMVEDAEQIVNYFKQNQ
jgi:hypothetical protein